MFNSALQYNKASGPRAFFCLALVTCFPRAFYQFEDTACLVPWRLKCLENRKRYYEYCAMGPRAPLALTQRTLGARVFLFVFPMIPSAETKSLQLLLNLLERFWVRGRDSDRLLVTTMMPNTNLLVLLNYSQPL